MKRYISVNMFYAALFSSMLVGCSSLPQKPVAKEAYIDLPEAFTWIIGDNPAKLEFALVPGRYKATREDAQGTYFAGPKDCFKKKLLVPNIWIDGPVGKWQTTDCGIYVPFAASSSAWIFRIFDVASYAWRVEGDEKSLTSANTVDSLVGVMPAIQPTLASAGPGAGSLGVGIGFAVATALAGKDTIYARAPEDLVDRGLRKHIVVLPPTAP